MHWWFLNFQRAIETLVLVETWQEIKPSTEHPIHRNIVGTSGRLEQSQFCQHFKLLPSFLEVDEVFWSIIRRTFVNHSQVSQKIPEIWHCSLTLCQIYITFCPSAVLNKLRPSEWWALGSSFLFQNLSRVSLVSIFIGFVDRWEFTELRHGPAKEHVNVVGSKNNRKLTLKQSSKQISICELVQTEDLRELLSGKRNSWVLAVLLQCQSICW